MQKKEKKVASNDIAIIGMNGRFPGASSVTQFFENLKQGKESITFLTDEELRQAGVKESLIQDPSYIKTAFVLDDIDKFDAFFFTIPPNDAQTLDPQQRLLMQCAWATFEDAGYTPDKSESVVGVFTGSGGSVSSYLLECLKYDASIRGETGSLEHMGNDKDFISTKISYKLNITGPSINVQTACSTSIVAVHLACQSILNKECDMALAGGVCVRVPHRVGYILKRGSIFSHNGHVRAFDADAQGMAFGSGLGLVLLKPLEHAIKDHDQIYAVIKGSAINNDGGQKMSYMATTAKGQVRCMQKAFEAAQISPDTISYVEAHGTGTIMGDPVEVAALTQMFHSADSNKKQYCALGSVKSNIGHIDIAAGIASLIKTAMCLRHKTLVPSINYDNPNPKIDFPQTPFYVNTKLNSWEVKGPRRACVNSLGIGGTNGFLVLEEAPERGIPEENEKLPCYLIPLSAKTEDALHQKKNDLSDWLNTTGEVSSIRDIAHTLQVGREHFSCRFACLAKDTQDLQSKIKCVLTENIGDDTIIFNSSLSKISNKDKEQYDEIIVALGNTHTQSKKRYYNDMLQIAKAYVQGYEVNWSSLANQEAAYKISLPTYPFLGESYWVQAKETKMINQKKPSNSYLHPLLQENTSNLSQQKYSSTFTGEEFFLKDHQIRGQKVLPSVAYLEMAQEAVKKASEGFFKDNEKKAHSIQLKNVIWARPIVVRENQVVNIGLYQEENGEISYDIYTDHPDFKDKPIIHSQGVAVFSPYDKPKRLNIDDLRIRLNKSSYNSQECYEAFRKIGFNYGPAHQGLKQIFVGMDTKGFPEVLAKLELPVTVSETINQFTLHPSLLDSALQSSVGIDFEKGKTNPHGKGNLSRLSLPFALENIEILGNCTKTMWVWVRIAEQWHQPAASEMGRKENEQPSRNTIQKLNIELCDEEGNICVKIRGYSSRVLSGDLSKRDQTIGRMLIKPVWNEKPVSNPLLEQDQKPINYTNHIVFLCGIKSKSSHLQSKIPQGNLPKIAFIDLESNRDNIEQRFEDYSLELFKGIQEVVKGKPKGTTLFQVLVPAQGAEQMFIGLSGLLKTAHVENFKMFGQVIAVEKEESPEELIFKLKENSTIPEDQQIRYEGQKRFAASFMEMPNSGITDAGYPNPWKEGGVYLITGGTGGLGLIFAKDIVSYVNNATIILIGRSGLTDEKRAEIRALESASVKIEYKSVDVSNKEAVAALVQKIQKNHSGLNGIIHCAGLIKDNFLLKKTYKEFKQVLAPKVAGTINLDEATKDVQLDFFVLFSSRSGVMGNVGQADYSTANAFMDAFAQYRHALVGTQRSGKTLSINWPLWEDGGMSIDNSLEQLNDQISGEKSMPTEIGVETLKIALSQRHPQVIILFGHLSRIREKILKAADFHINRDQNKTDIATPQMHEKSVQTYIVQYLKALLSNSLKLSKDKIKTDTNFDKYGIDSVVQLPILNKLETITGSLPKTLLFEYVNINELTEYLLEEHKAAFEANMSALEIKESSAELQKNGEEYDMKLEDESTKLLSRVRRQIFAGDRGAQQDNIANTETDKQNDIAIIGLAGRYPESPNLDVFWKNLQEGKNCITESPKDRFKGLGQQFQYDKPIYGGFISGIDGFDHVRFEVSEKEAQRMSPEQRLFLEIANDAVQDSGYDKESLGAYQKRQRVGVYVGTMYNQSPYSKDSLEAAMLSSNSYDWEIANRISHYFDLSGPSMALSTACSSSITAIYLASQALQTKEIGMAIAGGVNLTLNASKFTALEIAGYLGNGNKSKPFGDGSGYIPGEGVGAVVLKPLKDATRDGNHIYGVIKSCCVNHTGGRQMYAVPDPVLQGDLIRKTLEKSGVDFGRIQYIEAASNGSPLGDPIEIVALQRAFKGLPGNGRFRSIGTVKSNIGHLEAASGISQLTKVLLQMKNKKLVASIHAEPVNSNINWKNSSLKLQKQFGNWEKNLQKNDDGEIRETPRLALLNSFGAGGSCASMVIEEYDEQIGKRNVRGGQESCGENEVDSHRVENEKTADIKPLNEEFYKELFNKLRNKNITKEEIARKLSAKYDS